MALSSTEEAQTRALIAQQAAILSLASSEPTIISKLGATKVSLADLTAATSLGSSDLFLVRQGTTEKSTALSVLTPDASETVKGIVELATSAETLAGTDSTRAVHPAGLMSGFTKSFTSSGYQKLPSGLIIQWGYTIVTPSAINTIVLPIAFTSNLYNTIVSSGNGDGAASVVGVAVASATPLSTIRIRCEAGTSGLFFIVIGR